MHTRRSVLLPRLPAGARLERARKEVGDVGNRCILRRPFTLVEGVDHMHKNDTGLVQTHPLTIGLRCKVACSPECVVWEETNLWRGPLPSSGSEQNPLFRSSSVRRSSTRYAHRARPLKREDGLRLNQSVELVAVRAVGEGHKLVRVEHKKKHVLAPVAENRQVLMDCLPQHRVAARGTATFTSSET